MATSPAPALPALLGRRVHFTRRGRLLRAIRNFTQCTRRTTGTCACLEMFRRSKTRPSLLRDCAPGYPRKLARLKPSANRQIGAERNSLTLECVQGLILPMVQSGGSKTLRSGSLAKVTGLSPDTIRHYEKIGVLPRASRTDSGYRVYPASAVERVLVVKLVMQEALPASGFTSLRKKSSRVSKQILRR